MNETSLAGMAEENEIAALLRAAGARPAASAAVMADVRAAVETEWRATVDARRRRQRFTGWAAAAGIAVAAVGVWLVRPLWQSEPRVVASLVRSVGGVEQNRGDGRWTPLLPDATVESGVQLRTSGDGRVALRLNDGVELRLDTRTIVAFEDETHARLSQGAVYVDSGATGSPGPAFELGTPAGRVAHLGTQYEARLLDGTLRVGVREGRVRVSRAAGDLTGSAGESLTIQDDQVVRAPLAPTAAEWNWTASVTPPFDIEGRSVEDLLVWAARQTGRTILYASPEAARQARSITLSGTVQDLTPDEAVRAVLATTSLAPEISTERIRVEAAQR